MLINSPNISGSLTVTGNSVITGSLTVLGGINGAITGSAATASYVEYTNVANKPTLVSGSSQVTYSGLTGIPSGIVSGSSQVTYSGLTGIPSGIISGSPQITGFGIFATTGSNQFNGNQAITGSLTTTGTIVAQTLNVQQVTSSIVYSSGSNIFGNELGNTQQFTGSVGVTGSLTVAGAGTFSSSVTATGGTEIPNGQFYRARRSSSNLLLDLLGIESGTDNTRLLITGDFNIKNGSLATLLNMTTAGTTTFLGPTVTIGNAIAATNVKLILNGVASKAAGIEFHQSGTPQWYIGNGIASEDNNFELYNSNGTMAMKIIKSTNAINFIGAATFSSTVRTGGVSIGVASTANILDVRGENNTFDGTIVVGARGVLQHRDAGQTITSLANDYNSDSAKIEFRMKGNTTSDAKMTILGSGNVGIGTTSPFTNLEVVGGNNLPPSTGTQNYTIALRDPTSMVANVGGSILFQGFKTSTSAIGNFAYIAGKKENGTAGNEAGYLSIGTFDSSGIPAEQMRITSAGNMILQPGRGIALNTSDGSDTGYLAISGAGGDGGNRGGHIYLSGNERVVDAGNVVIAAGNISSGPGAPGAIVFRTGDGNERMRITPGGFLKASNTGNYVAVGNSYHEFNSNSADNNVVFNNTSDNPYGPWFRFASTKNNSTNYFWTAEDTTAVRGKLLSNGGFQNYQANDINLSDERTKKDIEPLESYWNKFKAIEIVKFKYKDQTHDDFNIGVIAQQVEAVAPEFVDVDGWDTKPKLDEEGNEIISEEEPLKSIYTADLHHATIKVLQEAMAKIETLEAENDTLKSRIDTLEQA